MTSTTALTTGELRYIFRMFDKDGNKTISTDELNSAICSLGFTPSQKQINDILTEFDTDNNGTLSFAEFAEAYKKWMVTGGAQSQADLMAAFKMFDEDDNGYLDRNEFKKIVTSMGSDPLNDTEFDNLMKVVDKNGDGKIDFDEMCAYLAPSNLWAESLAQIKAEKDNTIESIRAACLKSSGGGIGGLRRLFKVNDTSNGANNMDRDALKKSLAQYGVRLTATQADCVLDFFDADGDGTVDFNEFLSGLRGVMADSRKEWVDKAFNKFDINRDGHITMAELRQSYDTKSHPRVKSGELTEEEVFDEFLTRMGAVALEGQVVIPKEGWEDYYYGLSAVIESDKKFIHIIKTTYQLSD